MEQRASEGARGNWLSLYGQSQPLWCEVVVFMLCIGRVPKDIWRNYSRAHPPDGSVCTLHISDVWKDGKLVNTDRYPRLQARSVDCLKERTICFQLRNRSLQIYHCKIQISLASGGTSSVFLLALCWWLHHGSKSLTQFSKSLSSHNIAFRISSL